MKEWLKDRPCLSLRFCEEAGIVFRQFANRYSLEKKIKKS
jgi:hypothetical protein